VLMRGDRLWSLWARYRKTLYTGKWLQRMALAMALRGFVAVLAGWYTTETGRQPFTVYGLLRTTDSLSNIDAAAVGASLTASSSSTSSSSRGRFLHPAHRHEDPRGGDGGAARWPDARRRHHSRAADCGGRKCLS